jgi:HKD family nuclease
VEVSFGGRTAGSILKTIEESIRGFEELAIAVSYVQVSGWNLLKPLITGKFANVRLICTDQLGITDPAAVRAMQDAGVTVHAYTGTKIYHPKIFVASGGGKPARWVLGSANLSQSALQSSVEAVVANSDDNDEASNWFDELFAHESELFDEARIVALEAAYAARMKGNLIALKAQKLATPTKVDDAVAAETVEAAFASLPRVVVPLNADKAANNVRTLRRIKAVLDNPALLEGKALSEFKLIGLAKDGSLTPVGLQSKGKPLQEIARNWMSWLKHASTADIELASPSGLLMKAKIAFETFWSFPKEIRDFFLSHATRPTREVRPVLQVIELLANTGRRIPSLTIRDLDSLATVIDSTANLSPQQALAIRDYLANKGTRGWDEPDRVLVLEAWRQA